MEVVGGIPSCRVGLLIVKANNIPLTNFGIEEFVAF